MGKGAEVLSALKQTSLDVTKPYESGSGKIFALRKDGSRGFPIEAHDAGGGKELLWKVHADGTLLLGSSAPGETRRLLELLQYDGSGSARYPIRIDDGVTPGQWHLGIHFENKKALAAFMREAAAAEDSTCLSMANAYANFSGRNKKLLERASAEFRLNVAGTTLEITYGPNGLSENHQPILTQRPPDVIPVNPPRTTPSRGVNTGNTPRYMGPTSAAVA